MPFRLDKVGESFKLFNMTKKKHADKTFVSAQGAINFAKNAIRFREKKDSKVSTKDGKIFILPK
jgi:hypothetical protein